MAVTLQTNYSNERREPFFRGVSRPIGRHCLFQKSKKPNWIGDVTLLRPTVLAVKGNAWEPHDIYQAERVIDTEETAAWFEKQREGPGLVFIITLQLRGDA
jgi:hypothetical protein